MPSTYTVNLGIEKPATGEQSGTWGDTVNDNSNILDEAINGVIVITLSSAGSSGSPNTIAIADGASSTGRNKYIEFADGGDLGASVYVTLTPNDAEKLCFIRNSLTGSRSIFLFQGTYNTSNDLEIAAGTDVLVKFNGGGGGAKVVNVYANLAVNGLDVAGLVEFNSLSGTGSVAITDILDQDNMSSNSATALVTQQSIKAYVDSQVDTVDTLAEVLALGNTSGGTDIAVTTDDKVQFRDSAIYINSSADGQLDIVADTEIQLAATTLDINGAIQADGTVTVGVNDTGYDVKFFGATSGKSLLWDESADALVVTGTLDVNGAADVSGNLVVGGDLTITGDDLVMGTNTAGMLLVADGTNFNPTAVSSLAEISTAAADDIFIAIDASGGNLKKMTRATVIAGTGSSGDLAAVVDDTSPQLGGNLDMNGKDIVTTSNATIDLAPNGTGTVVVRGNTNSGAIVFNCESNTHGQKVFGQPHSASVTNTLMLPAGANSTLVSLVSVDTLTNKTLTSPKINENVAVTSTATELNILDGATVVVGEINALDIGTTAIGTAVASKAVILDSNKDYTGIRNLTITGELDAATLDISGNIDVDGTANLDVVDIDGAVDMATTLAVAGNVDFNGDLDVDGTTNLDVVDIDGAVNIAAATTIATNNKIQFRDTAIYLNSSADGQLDIVADTEIQITATTIDINGAINASGEIIAASLDISGNIDVDGTANLDVVDIDGAVNIAAATTMLGTLTVGVNDTGHDVKIFGATSGKYVEWDESVDRLTVSGNAVGLIVGLTDGSTISTNLALSNNFSVTLAGNRTLANPSNIAAGQSGSIFITQDGTGSRTLAYGSYFKFVGGTAPVLSTTAAAVDRIDYVVATTTKIHAVVSLDVK